MFLGPCLVQNHGNAQNQQFSEAIIKTAKKSGWGDQPTEVVLINLAVGTYCGMLCDVYTIEING